MPKVEVRPSGTKPAQRGTSLPDSARRRPPLWDLEAERRRRDLLDVLREERTPGSRRIHFEDP